MNVTVRRTLGLGVLLASLLIGGCATTPPAGTAGAPDPTTFGTNPADPWEAFNRKMFAFNDALDEAILKPVATVYRDVVPELLRRGVDNVLGNVGDVWSTANHFLQGKLESGFQMGVRVITNTVFGFGGIFDIATEARLERRSEDFGQTLGRWGAGTGPYVVWPLFGPRTVRDSFGLFVDWQFEPSRVPATESGRYAVSALALLNTRTNLLATSALLNQVALDRYTFVRDAYLQRRLDAVYDGAPPLENFDDEPDDSKKKK